jgi:hypothetical protein
VSTITQPTEVGLTADAPFVRRFAAWAADRFPPAGWLFFALSFLAASFTAALSVGAQPTVGWTQIAGIVAFIAFYLGVRIYDEHKDFDTDTRLHPERLTVTGVMPLAELRRVQAVGLVLQVAVCVVVDRGIGASTLTWAVATVWSLLMLVEFFVPHWLSPRLVIYALSHQIVVPLTAIWAATFGAGMLVLNAPIGWLCLLVTTSGLTFELCRKMHAPDGERDGVDSYTKAMGVTRAPLVALGIMALGTVALIGLIGSLATGPWWIPAVAAVAVLAVTGPFLAGFALSPTTKRAAVLEPVSAAYLLGVYVVLLTTLVTQRGIAWI